ncbi:unnamed protein product [Caretta caretta]
MVMAPAGRRFGSLLAPSLKNSGRRHKDPRHKAGEVSRTCSLKRLFRGEVATSSSFNSALLRRKESESHTEEEEDENKEDGSKGKRQRMEKSYNEGGTKEDPSKVVEGEVGDHREEVEGRKLRTRVEKRGKVQHEGMSRPQSVVDGVASH